MKLRLGMMLFLSLLLLVPAGFAQDEGVQEITDSINAETTYFAYYIPDLEAGDVIYLYAESDEIDPYLFVCDEECADPLIENDDLSDGNKNSAIEFEVHEDGLYWFVVSDCCSETVEGEIRILVSFDDPTVLTGEAEPTGAEIAFPESEESSKIGGGSTSSGEACVPTGRDVEAIFAAFEFSDADIQQILDDNDWGTLEDFQQLVDDGGVNWNKFLDYLREVSGLDLPLCEGGATLGDACVPTGHDVAEIFAFFEFSDRAIQNILDGNDWGSVENLQTLVDNDEIIWDKFIEYLQDVAGTNLPMCGGSSSSGGGSTSSGEACVPTGRDVEAIFAAFEFSDADIQQILDDNDWGTLEDFQQLVDDSGVNWNKFLDYLREVSGLDLPLCEGGAASGDVCVPTGHDVAEIFAFFEFSDRAIQNILDGNDWGSVENLQTLVDNDEIIWDKFIEYLQDIAGTNLPMCR